MKNIITITILLFLGLPSFGQDATTYFNKAAESYGNVNYLDALLNLSKAEKLQGANPKIEALRIFSYDALGDVKNTKISLLRYFALAAPEYKNSQAHKDILEINKRIDAQIALEDTKVKERVDAHRNAEADRVLRQQEAEVEKKKSQTVAENKQAIEAILLQNASSDLKSQLGKDAAEIEKMGVTFYKEAKQNLPDGTYTGELQNGRRHGQGTMRYSNGNVYSGTWNTDTRQGQGTMKYRDGQEFSGHWANDKRTRGTLQYLNSGTFQGDFDEDELPQKGRLTERNGFYKEGTFDKNGNLISGRLKEEFPSGIVYEGDVHRSEYSGQANIEYPNGDTYTGAVKNKLKEGVGKFNFRNGDYIDGTWANDKKTSGKRHYWQAVRLGTFYIGANYTGLMPSVETDELHTQQEAPVMGSLDVGYIWRWFNMGAGIGYFQQNKMYNLNGEQTLQNYGNLYLSANLGPVISLFQDHAIIRLNYEFGYLLGKLDQVDQDDNISNVIVQFKPVMVHNAQPEIIFRWKQIGLGIFYKKSFFADKNMDSPDEDVQYTGLPKASSIIGLRFIAFGAR